ncbi:glutamate formimidoyltransferase [candidate division KSB1 bacterium]|nr:glutamate formimidoyltransferase [candidate division KSB1 bacterium]
MPKLVECVPNFSEGRDKTVIGAITKEIETTEGVKLLDVDPGADTNRTVVTFIGTPEGVKEAAFKAIKKAGELIDMRKHRGAHARLGATDVCPFVPVSDVTMNDCVQIAKALGKRVADELGIPVYLYESAATRKERQNLADIRKGEYEGLPEKLKDPVWQPDFGEAKFNPRSGATVIGAREFLIAYNVNLNTRDRKLAHDIALSIREAGRASRDENGQIVRDEQGIAIKTPGILKAVKAVGWYIDEYEQAQISMNLVNYKITPPHVAFDEICRLAAQKGLRVTGSELVGLIPLQAMLEAGKYYLLKQGKSPGVPEKELIKVAIKSLGLNDIAEFDPDKKIIEYQFGARFGPLASMRVADFADETSTDSPAPGGGSVSALAGSMGAALTSMVANLTLGKAGTETEFDELKEVALRAQHIKDELLRAIDRDTDAFNRVMDAFRLPKGSAQQQAEREQAIQDATKQAALVPLNVMQTANQSLEQVLIVAGKGLENVLSDSGVAAIMSRACAEGAFLNVTINLKGIADSAFNEETLNEANRLLALIRINEKKALDLVESRMNGSR